MIPEFHVYFGLGSNIANELGTPVWHMQQAVKALANLHPQQEIQVSSLYKSLPMGPSDQPDYFNAVVCVIFDDEMVKSYSPEKLLSFTQDIENSGKREKKRHWGERSIDVDILLYGNEQINLPNLTIPHVGIFERNFVCVPLLELNKAIVISGNPLRNVKMSHDMTGLIRVKEKWC